MSAIVLQILSILGILLLIALCVLILVLVLLLFWPVTYRLEGQKSEAETTWKFRALWLFGLARAGYRYPDPGRLTVKLLWFTLYDSGAEAADTESSSDTQNTAAKNTGTKNAETTRSETINSAKHKQTEDADLREEARSTETCTKEQQNAAQQNTMQQDKESKDSSAEEPGPGKKQTTEDAAKKSRITFKERLFAKIEKIKYTIRKIYDKIRHILGEVDYYKELLQDEDTRALLTHARKRIGRVLHHIRPRTLKADILFGTGSPDTTGYAYGIYGMFSPQLGKDICITPDFTQQVLTGRIYAAGHVTVFTLLIHVMALLSDKRLRILIRRLKTHKL